MFPYITLLSKGHPQLHLGGTFPGSNTRLGHNWAAAHTHVEVRGQPSRVALSYLQLLSETELGDRTRIAPVCERMLLLTKPSRSPHAQF